MHVDAARLRRVRLRRVRFFYSGFLLTHTARLGNAYVDKRPFFPKKEQNHARRHRRDESMSKRTTATSRYININLVMLPTIHR